MHSSLTLPASIAPPARTLPLAAKRTRDRLWLQTLSAILKVVLRFPIFASVMLWPWEAVE